MLFERMLFVTPTRKRDGMHEGQPIRSATHVPTARGILVEWQAIAQGTAGWLGLRFQAQGPLG